MAVSAPVGEHSPSTRPRRHRRRRHRARALRRRAGSTGLHRPVGLYVASRLVVLLAAAIAGLVHRHLPLGKALTVWDSQWYLGIARHGYPHLPPAGGTAGMSTLGFFPFLPATIKAMSVATGVTLPVSGLVLCAVFGLAAALGVWTLCRDLWGQRAADRACAMFCFFPGAVVLSLVYTEGLSIALAAGCLLALHRRRWAAAGLLAAVATATHATGLALVVACAWAAGVAIYRRREWRSLLAPVLSPAGFIGFLAYLQVHAGSAFAYTITQRQGWGEYLTPAAPWIRISHLIAHPGGHFAGTAGWPPSYVMETANLAGLALFVVAAVVLVRARVPGTWLWYTGVIVVLSLFTTLGGLHPRFLLTAFPLVAVLGYRLRDTAFSVALALSAATLGLVTVVTVGTPLLIP